MNDISIEEIPDSPKNQRFYLKTKGRQFYVGEISGIIIRGIINNIALDEIVNEINNLENNSLKLTAEKVERIIEEQIKPLGIFDADEELINRKTSYLSRIFWKQELFNFKTIEPILSVFKYLFHPYIFFPALLILLGSNIYFLHELTTKYKYLQEYVHTPDSECIRWFSYILIFYPIIILILLFHEIGHASAAYFFKVKPRVIGFGFYFIFPVFYTDVTEIWSLTRWQRIIVNLSGVFIQLLINVVFIFWIYSTFDFDVIEIIRYVMILNIASIYINIIPFIKFDGYWVYSDLFKLPNLSHQSKAIWVKIINFLLPSIKIKISNNIQKIINHKKLSLIVFFIGRQLFLLYFIYVIFFRIFIHSIHDIIGLVPELVAGNFSICNVQLLCKTILIMGVFTFFTVQNYKSMRPSVRNFVKAAINYYKREKG